MWIARDKDGSVYLFIYKPTRGMRAWFTNFPSNWSVLSEKAVKMILKGRDLKWEDEPIELNITVVASTQEY